MCRYDIKQNAALLSLIPAKGRHHKVKSVEPLEYVESALPPCCVSKDYFVELYCNGSILCVCVCMYIYI